MISRSDFYDVMAQVTPFLSEVTALGLDTSAILQRLSNVRELPIYLVTSSSTVYNILKTPNIEVILIEEHLTHEDIITVDGLNCTSPERTIKDLLFYGRDPQVILESLARYYHLDTLGGQEESWGSLPTLMRQTGLYKDFETYIEDAEDYYSE